MTSPYDFAEAKAASKQASDIQRQAEQFVIDSTRRYANAERAYRKALAEKILELRASGTAITACGDIARGEKKVADLKYERDVAEGVREAASQAVWRATSDRKDEGRFLEWSMRVSLRDDVPEPDWSKQPVIGGRDSRGRLAVEKRLSGHRASPIASAATRSTRPA